jgi:hypothetical protein
MPIVQAGKQFTPDDIQRNAGDLATMLRDALARSNEFRVQLESWPDGDLVALGLTQDEINAIKGFFVGDLPALYNGFAASVWVKQLLGTGVV